MISVELNYLFYLGFFAYYRLFAQNNNYHIILYRKLVCFKVLVYVYNSVLRQTTRRESYSHDLSMFVYSVRNALQMRL